MSVSFSILLVFLEYQAFEFSPRALGFQGVISIVRNVGHHGQRYGYGYAYAYAILPTPLLPLKVVCDEKSNIFGTCQ